MSAEPLVPFEMVTGTWNTDAEEETTIYKSGRSSLHLMSTAVATTLQTKRGQWLDVEEDQWLEGRGLIRADDDDPANTVGLEIVWRDVDEVEVGADDIHNAAVTDVDTWEPKRGVFQAPTDTRYAHLRIGKSDELFNAYVDNVRLAPALAALHVFLDTVQTIEGALEDVVLDGIFQQVGVDFDDSTGIATILSPGRYAVTGAAAVDTALSSGKRLTVAIYRNGSELRFIGFARFNDIAVAAGYLDLEEGDTVKLRVTHDEGANRDLLDGTIYHNYMTLMQVE